MNIFEGARRIAKVAAAFWACTVTTVAFIDGAFDGRYELWSEVSRYVTYLIAGLLGIWVFTVSTGWIVRGFMGIPRGQDQRVDQ